MDDGIEKLVPRSRPEECDPERCGHACDQPTIKCYEYRIEWCRSMLRDFEDGFLVVQNDLNKRVDSGEKALIRVDGLLASINNMLDMVKLSVMILRGDFKEAEKVVDEGISDELDLRFKSDEDDDDDTEE
jgi:hypothetical protein